jgi:hypothetical protein
MPREEPPALLPADVEEAQPLATKTAAPEPARQAAPLLQPARPNRPAIPLAELNTQPLAQLLHSADAEMAQAARAELQRRGHAPLEIYLMDWLTDADPQKRARGAAALPGIEGLDARPWLLALSHDEDAAVRLTALTLMATSGEAQMLRRIREMAQTDADAKVRAQAQRVAR